MSQCCDAKIILHNGKYVCSCCGMPNPKRKVSESAKRKKLNDKVLNDFFKGC